ncbi:MAG TPA: tetratricopeptide repeat protein [Methylophilaceae bacterium]|nr:tetratricopeptide repeat protein [Methylophilaceae bacterium]
MPAPRTLATLLLIVAGTLLSPALRADELKDIAKQVRQGQYAAALARTNNYLAAHPADAQAMFLKGVALTELDKPDEAIQVFTEITEKYPNLPEPYNNLAVLYAGKGQYDKARTALETALKTHPSYATAHNNLADVYAHMASEAYDKALELDKNSNRARDNKLALIEDLPTATAGKPVMLAAKPLESRVIPKEAPKAAEVPPQPIKPAQQIKPAPAIKPAEPPPPPPSKVAKAEPAPVTPPKKTEPVPAEAPKPIPAPEKTKPADKPVDKPIDKSADKQSSEKAVKEAVQAWALAWSNQNVEKYLSSYADSFKTPSGESRKEWEKTRRERLTSPASIKVEVSSLRVTMEDADHARADFKQTYRAGSTVMRTTKTLDLRNAAGKWQIEQERTSR